MRRVVIVCICCIIIGFLNQFLSINNPVPIVPEEVGEGINPCIGFAITTFNKLNLAK